VNVGDGRTAAWHRDLNHAARIRVSGRYQEAKLIHKVDPIYPAQARAARISGNVTLEITIGQDGRVENVKPVEGHPVLAAAAQEAVRQWVYQPTLLQGTPVDEVITTVTLAFDPNR
jgi:protein TonB